VRAWETADDGSFRIDSVLAEFPACFDLALGDRALAQLPRVWSDDGLCPFVSAIVIGSREWSGTVEVEELLLLDCIPVRVSVASAEGTPAAHATLCLVPMVSDGQLASHPRRKFVTDRRGVATFLLPPSAGLVLGVEHEGNAVVRGLATRRGPRVDRPIEVRIRLEPKVLLRGRAVDPAGGPATGIEIRLEATPWRSHHDEPDLVRELSVTHARIIPLTEVADRDGLRDAVRRAVGRFSQVTRTGDSGEFEFELPPLLLRLSLLTAGSPRPVARFDGIPDDAIEVEVPHSR
jgi:hypothetical protein